MPLSDENPDRKRWLFGEHHPGHVLRLGNSTKGVDVRGFWCVIARSRYFYNVSVGLQSICWLRHLRDGIAWSTVKSFSHHITRFIDIWILEHWLCSTVPFRMCLVWLRYVENVVRFEAILQGAGLSKLGLLLHSPHRRQ